MLAFSWFFVKRYVYLKIDYLIPASYLLRRTPEWPSHHEDLVLVEDFTTVVHRK